jgi:hypothetical protein
MQIVCTHALRRCYMREEPPYQVDPARVATLQPVLRVLVRTMLNWRPHG